MGGEEGCISEELGRKKPESENIRWKISIFNKKIEDKKGPYKNHSENDKI